jgi:uncharacterized protein with HEPN domain
MSDSRTPQREWRFYIQDMMGFAEKCLSYTVGMDQQTFTSAGTISCVDYEAGRNCLN